MNQPAKVYVTSSHTLQHSYKSAPVRKKLTRRKKKPSPFRLLLLAVVAAYLLAFGYWSYKINQLDAQIRALEMEKEAVLAEQNRLLEQKQLVMSPEYVEKLARENLGLVKPGEKVVLFAKPGEVMPLKEAGSQGLYD